MSNHSDIPMWLRDRARNAVKMALRSGRLVKGPCCFGLRSCRKRVEAHHVDYSQPLLVYWVCKRHHRAIHWDGLLLPDGAAPAPIRPRKRDFPPTAQPEALADAS